MFHQADLSQFFLGNSGFLKRQNEQRTNILEITKSPNALRQFLKERKQNRPWLVDTETGMVCSYCKEKKNENSFTTGCTSYKHPHHMSSSKLPRNLISTINF
jgi:hypothetical protein